MSFSFRAFERFVRFLRNTFSAFVVVLFIMMMGLVLTQIGGRYVFNYSIAVASELATFGQVWLVLLGSGVAMARHQHVAIDFLPAKLPLHAARAVSIFVAACVLAFLAVVGWGSLPLIRMGAMQTAPASHLSMWYIYLCLPIGAVYIALELVVSVVARWNNPFPQADDLAALQETIE